MSALWAVGREPGPGPLAYNSVRGKAVPGTAGSFVSQWEGLPLSFISE